MNNWDMNKIRAAYAKQQNQQSKDAASIEISNLKAALAAKDKELAEKQRDVVKAGRVIADLNMKVHNANHKRDAEVAALKTSLDNMRKKVREVEMQYNSVVLEKRDNENLRNQMKAYMDRCNQLAMENEELRGMLTNILSREGAAAKEEPVKASMSSDSVASNLKQGRTNVHIEEAPESNKDNFADAEVNPQSEADNQEEESDKQQGEEKAQCEHNINFGYNNKRYDITLKDGKLFYEVTDKESGTERTTVDLFSNEIGDVDLLFKKLTNKFFNRTANTKYDFPEFIDAIESLIRFKLHG